MEFASPSLARWTSGYARLKKGFQCVEIRYSDRSSETVVRLNSNKKKVPLRVRLVLRKTTGEVFLIDQIPPNVALDALSAMIASWSEEH